MLNSENVNKTSIKPLILKGYDISKKDYLHYNRNGKIVRLGIHVSCPPCNLRCPYCLNSEGFHLIEPQQKKDQVSIGEMFNWIDEAAELDVKCVVIDGIYEPLMNKKDTFQLIKHIRSKAITPILITNTILLHERDVEELAKHDCSILGKLNVPMTEKEHSRYLEYAEIQMNLTGYTYSDIYERLKKSIRMLIDYGFNKMEINQHGQPTTRLGVDSVITPLNYEHIPELYEQLLSSNIYLHLELVKSQGGGQSRDFHMSPQKIEKLSERLKEINHRFNIESGQTSPAYLLKGCFNNMGTININLNGDVIPCPSIELIVGNLREQSISLIMENKYMQMIRNLEENIQGDCKDCELFKQHDCYGGCRGNTYMYLRNRGYSIEESLVASDPACWRVTNILDKYSGKPIIGDT